MQNKSKIRIATRQSLLALWQANYVKNELLIVYPDLDVELVPMTTEGDIHLDTTLQKIGGKGLFVKELEQALLDNRADIAVHSMKDVPMEFSPDFCLAAICERADPRDAFVSIHYESLVELPERAIVGTSSLRRQCQVHALRPDLQIEPLRGNVDSRVKKLEAEKYAAIILAAAGLHRLQFNNRIKQYLTKDELLPAIGQGAIGIECRHDDVMSLQYVQALNHEPTALAVNAERAMGRRLNASCHVPVAAFATIENNSLKLQGLVGTVDGKRIIRAELSAAASEAQDLGNAVAELLLSQGAKEILRELSN